MHKITWKLIEDLNWIERPFLTDGILFKMRNDDTHVLVKIGATETEPIDQDVWDEVSMLSRMSSQSQQNNLPPIMGWNILEQKQSKARFVEFMR